MSSLKRWFPQWKQRYSNIESFSEDDEKSSSNGLLPDSEASSQDSPYFNRREQQSGPSRRVFYGSLLLNCVLLIGCGVLAGQTWPQLNLKMHDPFNNYLLKQVSMPSPILDDIHIPLGTVRRNGSLLPNHPASVFRQDPSHEVDMAWHRLSNINPIPITAQDVRNIGYNPDEVAKWPAEYGLGDDAYVARLDVFHEIHCLDMLRREIHFDHYYSKKGWKNPGDAPADHRIHISHCIYALLQSLTCSANTDPFIHYWVDIGDEPYPDFSINRQCRDFESVLAWQEEKGIPMSQYRDVIRKPEGVTPRIMSLEYKYMVGLIQDDPGKIQEALDEAAKLDNV